MTTDQSKAEVVGLAFVTFSIGLLVSVIVRPIMIGFWLGWNGNTSTSLTAHVVIIALTLSLALPAGLKVASELKARDTRRQAAS